MFKHTFSKIKIDVDSRLIITFGAIIMVGLALVGYAAFADKASAGSGGSDSNSVVFTTNAVEFQITRPVQVTLVWSATQNDPETNKVFPGQELAIGAVDIENESPVRYGVSLRPEPLIPGDSYPQLTLLYFLNGVEYQQYAPILLEPGTTVSVQVRIFVDWGAQPTSFRGLNLVVDVGPPPTETTTECPINQKCG